MELRTARFSPRSISFKILIIIAAITIPVFILQMFKDQYALQLVRNQVADSYQNLASVYMQKIDQQLSGIDEFLIYYQAFNTSLILMDTIKTDQSRYMLAKIDVFNSIANEITRHDVIEAIWIYSSHWNDVLPVFNVEIPFERKQQIITEMTDTHLRQTESIQPGWRPVQIGPSNLLLRVFLVGDLVMAATVDPVRLLEPLNQLDLGDKGMALLADFNGKPVFRTEQFDSPDLDLTQKSVELRLSGSSEQFLAVGQSSTVGDFRLITLIPERHILDNLPFFQRFSVMITYAFLIMLPIAFILLRKTIWLPINRLLRTMAQVEQGNLQVRTADTSSSVEFAILNRSFNAMLDQIQKLKINIYEEQIARQQIELEHLQLQIRPHFFLNSLNIIFSLAKARKFELIQEMTYCLIEYLRFMFRSNTNFVLLKDEIKHVKNYIRIQQLRSPGSITADFNVPDYLCDSQVPPLIVQLFAENTLKYAAGYEQELIMTVQTSMEELEGGRLYLKIKITDNGPGFSPEILEQIRQGERIIRDGSAHIGIRNIHKRLAILYKGQAVIDFFNADPHGAVVDIHLPLYSPDSALEGMSNEPADSG